MSINTKKNVKFSLALTTYNRADRLIPSIKKYELYEDLDEIVIIDDFSEDFNILKAQQWSSKVKIKQNQKNLGVYLNKIEALSSTANERVLLFDSDNFFKEDYLKILKQELIKNNFDTSIIYSAEKALPNFDYQKRNLSNLIVDKSNWNTLHLHEGAFLNTGNQFFSREAINCLISNLEKDQTNPFAVDSKYINYILIKNGFKIKCTAGLSYHHAISNDSIYILTEKNSINFHNNFNWTINP